MSRLSILSSDFVEVATIYDVISCEKNEVINGENTLNFSLHLSEDNQEWINDTNVIGLDGDYFDIIHYRKEQESGGELTVSADCEHVSYRLNRPEYDAEYFTESDTPESILSKILLGTGFVAGTVDFSGVITYSIQEKMSRRAILVQFAELLGGELLFDGFTVSILSRRGNETPKNLMTDKNIIVLSKDVDKTSLDEIGNPIIAYECELIEPMDLSLGDAVTIDYETLDIGITLRIVSISADPYNNMAQSFSVSNTVPSLEDEAYRIETSTVAKDKYYNGTRIGPEYGFEAVRSDKKARAFFRSDGMKFQSGDGSGTTWKDRLYYEYDSETDETVLVFDGKLSADIIEALSAVITPNLYAGKATIAELTVDQLDTGDKVQKYLSSDESDVNYVRIYDQYVDFVTAAIPGRAAVLKDTGTWDLVSGDRTDTYYTGVTVDPITGNISYTGGQTLDAYNAYSSGHLYREKDSGAYYMLVGSGIGSVDYEEYGVELITVTYEQAKNRDGEALYWVDETHKAASTTETAWPVMMYQYAELMKLRLGFKQEPSSGYYMPVIELGAGTGTGERGKGYIYKGISGLYMDYYSATDGSLRRILLGDDGIVLTPYALESLDFYTNGFSAKYTGEQVNMTWQADEAGIITELITEDYIHIPVNWHEGDM